MKKLIEIFSKAKQTLISPSKFFKKIKKEKGLEKPFIYYSIISLIGIIIGITCYYMFFPINLALSSLIPILGATELIKASILIPLSFFGWILNIFWSFVSAAIIHIWIKLFGAKGKYEDTYKIYSYSSTPYLLFKGIPLIGFIGTFYKLYLLIIGTHEIHKISKKKATIAYLIPIALILILILVIIYFSFSLMQSNPELLTKTN